MGNPWFQKRRDYNGSGVNAASCRYPAEVRPDEMAATGRISAGTMVWAFPYRATWYAGLPMQQA
ncbi:MAG: hypothetical protein AMXMBFR84_30190 [Candidatus Hydrogenedentota bacterium]